MPTRYPVDSVLTNCDRIVRVWADNSDFSLGEVTLDSVKQKIVTARQKRERLEQVKMQVTALSNDLTEEVNELAAIYTRALSGLRAVFGPNSTQYEQGGGTRADERRRPSHKKVGGEKS